MDVAAWTGLLTYFTGVAALAVLLEVLRAVLWMVIIIIVLKHAGIAIPYIKDRDD